MVREILSAVHNKLPSPHTNNRPAMRVFFGTLPLLSLVSLAAAIPNNPTVTVTVTATAPGPTVTAPANVCSTGAIQCCQSTEKVRRFMGLSPIPVKQHLRTSLTTTRLWTLTDRRALPRAPPSWACSV